MTTINVILSHPIVFVFDVGNERMEVPEYDPDSTVSFNEHCVSIISGCEYGEELEIELVYDAHTDITLKKVFDGFIKTPNKKIAVVTSLNEKLMELDVKFSLSSVNVYVDNHEHPSRILVNVK